MNHNLIIENKNNQETAMKTRNEINSLTKFLTDYEFFFTYETSKQALAKIRQVLIEKESELKELHNKDLEYNTKLRQTCLHEILHDNTHEQHSCQICGMWFYPRDVNFDHFLIKTDTYKTGLDIIREIIIEMAKNKEKPLEVLEDYVANNDRLENIKIYKRRITKWQKKKY